MVNSLSALQSILRIAPPTGIYVSCRFFYDFLKKTAYFINRVNMTLHIVMPNMEVMQIDK